MTGSRDRWDEVERLYAEALARPPREREAYLAEACDDEAVRREVTSLLAGSSDAEALFERLEESVRRPPDDALAPRREAGTRVGPFAIEEEIGRGGMGVVYRARDTRLDRAVALKFLPPWLSADPAAIDRFEAEARAASAIDHPNIATVYEIGEDASGTRYIAMAHYEGETLVERLRRGPLAPDEAREVGRQIAEGLAAAHAKGIVHRDIKPANVFLTDDGRVVILDFGVAKILEADRTATGREMGTAAYMSPEQVRGDAVGPPSDQWSLGVVLYEAVAGKRPFEGERALAVARAIAADEPAPSPPSDVPPELASVIGRLLEKRPGDRFGTAREAARALAGPGTGTPAGRRAGGRRARIRPGRATAIGAIALVLALGWALGAWLERGEEGPVAPAANAGAAEEPVRVAILPFSVRGASQYDYLAEGLVDLLSASLDGVGSMRSVDPQALMARAKRARGRALAPAEAAEVAAELDAERFVIGDVVEIEDRLRIRTSLYDRAGPATPIATAVVEGDAERLFNLVDELTAQLLVGVEGERVGPSVRVAALTTSSLPALKAYLDGERAMRAGEFETAVAAFGQAVEADTTFALAHYRLSKAASWDRRYGLARRSIDAAVRHAGRLGPDRRRLVEASAAVWRGDREEAERMYRLVLSSAPDHVEAWHELGELLFHYNLLRGRTKLEAKDAFGRALALDPGHGESLLHLMELAAWEGDRERFASLYERFAERTRPALEWRALRAFVLGTADDRARILGEMAEADERNLYRAIETVVILDALDPDARRAAELLTEPSRPRDWRGIGHWVIAQIELARGRWSEAEAAFERAARFEPAWALEFRALFASQPFLAPEAGARAIRRRLAAWDPATAASVNRIVAAHDGLHDELKPYLLGGLDARLERFEAAEARVRELAAGEGGEFGDALASCLRGRLAWERGEPEAAIDAFERGRLRIRGDMLRSPVHSQFHERYLLAEALREAGRGEEALGWYASVGDHTFYGLPYKAATHVGRGRIHEDRGEPEAAIRHYREALALWSDPDPFLASRVADVRARLRSLERRS